MPFNLSIVLATPKNKLILRLTGWKSQAEVVNNEKLGLQIKSTFEGIW